MTTTLMLAIATTPLLMMRFRLYFSTSFRNFATAHRMLFALDFDSQSGRRRYFA